MNTVAHVFYNVARRTEVGEQRYGSGQAFSFTIFVANRPLLYEPASLLRSYSCRICACRRPMQTFATSNVDTPFSINWPTARRLPSLLKRSALSQIMLPSVLTQVAEWPISTRATSTRRLVTSTRRSGSNQMRLSKLHRGLAYSDQGDFDKAISDFNKAISARTKCGYLCTSRTSLFRPGQLGQGD